MKKIETSLSDFLSTVSLDFNGLLVKIEQMRENMTRLIKDRKQSESMLYAERIEQKDYTDRSRFSNQDSPEGARQQQ